jgi:DNA-binding MarR family transcriptional regulator
MESTSFTNYTGYMLQHVSDVLAKQSDQVLLERLGVGFSQVKILMVLQANPTAKQKQIAARLGQTEASISRQVKLMIKKSLLRSSVNKNNRREHISNLTLKGERIVQEALAVLNHYHQPIFENITDKQKQLLIEALRLIHQNTCNNNRIGSCDHPMGF